MLTLDPEVIRERLRLTVPTLASIGLARDFGAVRKATIRWPSAWIIVLGEDAGENRYASSDLIEQAVTTRVGVIMAIRDIADRTGARASTDLKSVREAVMLSLCTFVPEAGGQAFRFAKGSLQSGVDEQGGLFWQDEFKLRFDRRIQIT